ncbi:hypothetical protein ABB30_09005 [Stenotrophomonas ginsengisoli]|uniref:Uncharacterized protein n=1 Tax=Stenotrophomonas ginsengisoli TaxID=336566 RepID=A0A0R0DHA9_9GAMM|nr:hypothetical protein ABB30_09005 [Stenotrophomonas ginsengisoli]
MSLRAGLGRDPGQRACMTPSPAASTAPVSRRARHERKPCLQRPSRGWAVASLICANTLALDLHAGHATAVASVRRPVR